MATNTILEDYNDVLIPQDLMEILHIGRNSVYKLLEEGQIKSIKVGCSYRIPKINLIKYLFPDSTAEANIGG